MFALDTNVLVYAHRREVAEHDAARDLWQAELSTRNPF